MAGKTMQLGRADSRRMVAALEHLMKTPTSPKRTRTGKRTAAVGTDEVLVAVMGSEGAVVRRKRVGGRPIDLRELRLRLMGAEQVIDDLAEEPTIEPPSLTPNEDALLASSGLPDRRTKDVPGALERTRVALDLLLRDSMTLEETARVLHLKTTSRLRQRLAGRTLYGVKEGRSWRIPRFQFRRGKLVRGIEAVLPHVRADAHPVAVKRWFTSPHQDLPVDDDGQQRVTPLVWLEAGNPPDVVARLAEEI